MPQAFISYASEDAIFADLTQMKLEAAGIDVWVDHGQLKAGDEWRAAIDEGIAMSDVLLLVVTPESCESPYVTYEWAFALGQGIKVLPLLLRESELHPRLDVLQCLDFRNPRSAPWNDLFEEVTNNAGRRDTGEDSNYVKDLTVERFRELIAGAVSMATGTANKSVPETVLTSATRGTRSPDDGPRHYSLGVDDSGPSERTKILWVDDRPHNNRYERAAFEAMGFTFTLALSTKEALEVLSTRRFAAIISDMGRREGPTEGYALLGALREKGDETPYFIYAGSNAPEHKREAEARGAQGSTNSPQELFELVTRFVM